MTAAAFLMGMRTGKTLTSVAVLGRLYLDGRVSRALVIAPASVLPVWRREFEVFAEYDVDVLELSMTGKKRIQLLERVAVDEVDALQVVVINYEAIGRSRQVEDLLRRWAPDIIVADEMHRLKHSGSQQSKAIRRLATKAKYRLGLTGTPFSQNPGDAFGQWLFLDPSILGTSHTAFKARYMHERPLDPSNPYGPKIVVGPRPEMLPELTAKVHSISFEVALEDCYDMPAAIEVDRYCDLPDPARRMYRSLARDSIAEIEAGGEVVAQNVLTRALRLQQLAGGFVNDDDGAVRHIHSKKLDLLGEVLDEILAVDGEKVVVFAKYTAEIHAIGELLKDRSVGYVGIDGSVSKMLRGGIVEDFQRDGGPRVFVGQVKAAGEGIALHAAATTVFYSLPTSVSDWLQARARIDAVGSERPSTYINLLARDTIDEHVAAALASKQGLAQVIQRGWRRVLGA